MPPDAPPIRILLVDDHLIVRQGLRALLQAEPDLLLIAEADCGADALRLAPALLPDVILLDIGLRDLNGVEVLGRLRTACPAARGLILSMYDDPATIAAARRAGARGYVVKGRGIDSLIDAIRLVQKGQLHFPAPAGRPPNAPSPPAELDPLTPREREILGLLSQGLSGPQIALRLGLRQKTIENHRARIMEKLDIHTTAGLVRYALLQGASS